MCPGPSSTVEEIISAAMDRYASLTGKDLLNQSLAIEIRQCGAAPAICQVLQQHARAFHDHTKLVVCLNAIVDNLYTLPIPLLSEVASLRIASSPLQLVFSALNILLSSVATKKDAFNRVANFEALVDLLLYIEVVLRRLKIKPEAHFTPSEKSIEILAKIIIELISIFAIATKAVSDNEGPLRNYATQLQGESNIERVLQRLDRLSPEEAWRVIASIFEVVYGLVNSLTLAMEGKAASMEDIAPSLCEIQQVVIEMARVDRYALQEKFRRWLSPPDTCQNHNIALPHYNGTSSWFTEGQTFKNWDKTGGLLWIYGKPGSGKTVLWHVTHSTIVSFAKHMRTTGLATVGYFYVGGDSAKREPRSLLCSLVTQLCSQSDRLGDTLSSLYVTHEHGLEQPSDDALVQCLREMLEYPNQPPVFIVVDALDEFPNSQGSPGSREYALDIVQELVELNLPHLHFCITSRPEIDIQRVLDSLGPYSVPLHEQQQQIDDITKYVERVLRSDVHMRVWPQETKELVVKTLVRECDGLYQWVSCQLEILRLCPLQRIPFALKELQGTLNQSHEWTLQSIDEDKWELAHRIFQFLTVSERPLHVQELADIFAISLNEEKTGIPEFNIRWRPQDAEAAVLSACSGMITIVPLPGQTVVQFSHESIKDFLTSNRVESSPRLSRYHVLPRSAHTSFARACLSVLLRLDAHIHKDNIKEMFPLALYAAKYWVVHAQCGDVSSLIEDGMDRLFDKDKLHFATWVWVYDIDNPSGSQMDCTYPETPETAPLYYAALCGFIDIVECLIDLHPEDVHTRGRDGGTPLHAALRNGHSDVALLLLRHQADENAGDNRGETPLQIAAHRGDIKVMQSLIASGAKVNAKNRCKETSLSLASSKGTLEAARLLLEHGADVEHQGQAKQTALHVAAEQDHYSITELLLDNGANVNAQDRVHRTPLHRAVAQGKVAVAKLLLQRRADVNACEASQLTPLHIASLHGQVEAVRLLLDFGADVDAADGDGWTPLHLAEHNGYLEVGKLLATRGATCDIKNKDASSPFEVALDNHDNESAQFYSRALMRRACEPHGCHRKG